jgi:hypothetical protein
MKKIELIFFGKIASSGSIDDQCLIKYPENNWKEGFSFKYIYSQNCEQSLNKADQRLIFIMLGLTGLPLV